MRTRTAIAYLGCQVRTLSFALVALLMATTGTAFAQPAEQSVGGEANLTLPDLTQVTFFGGIDGHKLLMFLD